MFKSAVKLLVCQQSAFLWLTSVLFLERFEVEYSSMFFDFVRVIEFDEVRRNENGEFVFNKEGYPIVRKTAFQQFIYDDYQRFMRFIHFFTRWFD